MLLDGKYSELSKTGKGIILGYFDKEFGKPLRLGMEQIFNRDKKLKKEWEAKIGMELPPNAELHTKLSLDVLNLDCALI